VCIRFLLSDRPELITPLHAHCTLRRRGPAGWRARQRSASRWQAQLFRRRVASGRVCRVAITATRGVWHSVCRDRPRDRLVCDVYWARGGAVTTNRVGRRRLLAHPQQPVPATPLERPPRRQHSPCGQVSAATALSISTPMHRPPIPRGIKAVSWWLHVGCCGCAGGNL
jgi:hypothetical protein